MPDEPFVPPVRYGEDSEAVLLLARQKSRMHVFGLSTVYRLRNGWIARRRALESRASRRVRWTIFANEDPNSLPIGEADERLTAAIADALNRRA